MEHSATEYTLTADEMGMVQPLIAHVEETQREAQAILRAITRLRGLEGNWNLVGDKLIKANSGPNPGPAPQPVEAVGAGQNGNG